MVYTEYDSNNSGGDWWLTDENWQALEEADWKVRWVRDNPDWYKGADRWLGALARSATRELPLREAIAEWERVTGLDSSALGCSCCGTPHSFTEYDEEGEYVKSYSPDYPEYGQRYDEW
jgi:hypothetical protein